MYAILKTETE